MKKSILSAGLILGFAWTSAQVKTPQASPAASVSQNVGLTEITVQYSRPSAKERKIFGDVVPMNTLWRTGANSSTRISFSTEAFFGEEKVAAGEYALYTIPHEDYWEFYLYSDTSIWGAPKELDKDKVVVATKVKVQKAQPTVESFKISFDNLTDDSATLDLAWQNTLVQVPIRVTPHDAVMESIKSTMAKEPTANDYAAAGTYYFKHNIELKTALTYLSKSLEENPKAFWNITTKAEVLAALGKYDEAIKTAAEAMELAKAAEYDAYINKNRNNIDKWEKEK